MSPPCSDKTRQAPVLGIALIGQYAMLVVRPSDEAARDVREDPDSGTTAVGPSSARRF